MSRVERTSFILMGLILLMVGWSGLSTPFITVLFTYLALDVLLSVLKKPWLSVLACTVLVIGIFYGFVSFLRQAIQILPHVASASVPVLVESARTYHLESLLPFDDAESFKQVIIDLMHGELGNLANYAKVATKEFVFLLIGLVVAASLFLNGELDLDRDRHRKKNNLYSALCQSISARFKNFYLSFSTVMGAQLLISIINTSFTALYVIIAGVPHAAIIVGITFLCGMLPIVGNLISNSIIFSVAVTISVNEAVAALIFLIVLHKFEYFLNSKIIGSRIRNPMWLTLLGLVVGEKLIGIPGMILAPVLLNYIKIEASDIEVN
ncbi:MAG: AI-2E family transporter [Bdellovibrionota bacterium]